MDGTLQKSTREAAWWARLRRPNTITEGTRWLFAVLALVSMVFGLTALGQATSPGFLALGLAAGVVLAASWSYGYLTRNVPLALDVVDAAALFAFAIALPNPAPVIAITIPAIWFRSLYGTLGRAVVRCVLYVIIALVAPVLLWPLIPGHAPLADPSVLLGAVPTVFITLLVARELGRGLLVREQTLSRDAALAALGSRLLGVTDDAAIRAMAWVAAVAICEATPGLRVIKASRDGDILRIGGATGGLSTVLASMPGTVITTSVTADGLEAIVTDSGPLDAAVGTPLAWACINMVDEREETWAVIGAPVRIPAEATLAMRGLLNQTSLALRNSDVHQALTVQARIDFLTGLGNRVSFTAALGRSLGQPGAAAASHLLFLDLDDFKDVNDILGHQAGDDLLVEVAVRLRTASPEGSICARLGGDEFAVVLLGATDADAVETAQRIVDSIAEPVRLGGHSARVGASVGIAEAAPGIDAEQLTHQADVAMYSAKAQGKGRVQLFDSGLLQADSSRLSFERQIAGAAAAGELVVHYQPVLSVPQLRCTAVEALVRWEHPEQGLLPPGDFIAIAERSGAIVDIGEFVLRRACADAMLWDDDNPGAPLAMHVNVSARELDNDHFIDTVLSCLDEARMPPDRLVLELTETVVLNSPSAILRLKALAERGVKIALDDFGTGYSSLTTLRSLPVDVIKLDRTFIAGALANTVDRTVIASIVQMSTRLGLQTIAEGVERVEQQAFLEEIGCDAVQGFLYQRPVPATVLGPWLIENLRERPDVVGSVVPFKRRSAERQR